MVDLTWVERTTTVYASDRYAVAAIDANPGWRLIATGSEDGATTLTYGWPWPAESPVEGLDRQVGPDLAAAVQQARSRRYGLGEAHLIPGGSGEDTVRRVVTLFGGLDPGPPEEWPVEPSEESA